MLNNDQNNNVELISKTDKLEEIEAAVRGKKKLYMLTKNNIYTVVYKDAAGITKKYCCQSEIEMDKLTDYIWKNCFNEIGKTGNDDTAVDVAIRELKEMKNTIDKTRQVLRGHGQRDLMKEIFEEKKNAII